MKRRAVKRKALKFARVIHGPKPRKHKRKFHAYIIWTLIFVFIILSVRYIEKGLLPTVLSISSMRIQTISNDIISKAIEEAFKENNISTEDLATYYYDDKGNMVSFGVNTVMVNEISACVMEKISKQVKAYNGDVLYIPLGRVLGSSLFSNLGPRIKIKIMPYGTTTISYNSAFESQGINQINHKIWLNVEMWMQVVAPLNKAQSKVSQKVTLVDRVINGQVPDSYINVPKDEVLNVAN